MPELDSPTSSRRHPSVRIAVRLGSSLVLTGALALLGCQNGSNAVSSSQTSSPGAAPMATNPSAAAGGATGAAGGNDATAIFQSNCARCHKAGSLGTGRSDISHIGAEKDQKWIEVQIRDPASHNSRMPPFDAGRLSDKDLHTVAAWLAAMK